MSEFSEYLSQVRNYVSRKASVRTVSLRSIALRTAVIAATIAAMSMPARAEITAKDIPRPVQKIIWTDWIKAEALKQGTLISLCAYQGLNGLVDGYHFSDGPTHLIREENYHQFVTMQRTGGVVFGWFSYATIANKHLTATDKVRRFVGSALIARNAFEWSYKYARYGNPFDYTEDRNEHAVVYFGFREGRLIDCYIGTGPVTGPLVDIGCLVAGLVLFK